MTDEMDDYYDDCAKANSVKLAAGPSRSSDGERWSGPEAELAAEAVRMTKAKPVGTAEAQLKLAEEQIALTAPRPPRFILRDQPAFIQELLIKALKAETFAEGYEDIDGNVVPPGSYWLKYRGLASLVFPDMTHAEVIKKAEHILSAVGIDTPIMLVL